MLVHPPICQFKFSAKISIHMAYTWTVLYTFNLSQNGFLHVTGRIKGILYWCSTCCFAHDILYTKLLHVHTCISSSICIIMLCRCSLCILPEPLVYSVPRLSPLSEYAAWPLTSLKNRRGRAWYVKSRGWTQYMRVWANKATARATHMHST